MEGKYSVIAFIQGANHHRYSGLWRDLKNNMVLGQDNYPKTLPAAYDVLLNYKTSGNKQGGGDTNVRVSFLQTGDNGSGTGAAQPMVNWQIHVCEDGQTPVPGRNGICFPTLKCYRCQRYGHVARFCSSNRNTQGLQVSVSLTQARRNNELDEIHCRGFCWILVLLLAPFAPEIC